MYLMKERTGLSSSHDRTIGTSLTLCSWSRHRSPIPCKGTDQDICWT